MRDYLRRLAEQGLLLLSGPHAAAEAPGALLLFRADDEAQVAALVGNDPFSAKGVVAETWTWPPSEQLRHDHPSCVEAAPRTPSGSGAGPG